MIGGFGTAGMPAELIEALIAQGASDLTIISNNAGNAETGLAALLKAKRIRKIVCSFPRQSDSWVFDGMYRAGEIALELYPRGRSRSAIAPPGPVSERSLRPTATGRSWRKGRKRALSTAVRTVLEYALQGDVALIKAHRADRWGNLVYRGRRPVTSDPSWRPRRAARSRRSAPSSSSVLDPQIIVTPSNFVHRVVIAGRAPTPLPVGMMKWPGASPGTFLRVPT